jgi:drug/metabolite transporter (DMT)-like permease
MERSLRGIAMLVGATVLFSMSDATAKYLTGSLPPIEIAWFRYVVFTLMATAPLLRSGRAGARARRPLWQILRGLGVVGSAVFFIASLATLPMAEATTVGFASPLLISALSVPVLGERVGLSGWAAVFAGFVGVLIVARPGTNSFHPAVLLVLLSSLCWVMAMLITRRMGRTERSSATLLWTAGTGLVVLTALLPSVFVMPDARSLGLSAVIGLVASGGQWLTILAYRNTAASVLAPLSYGQLIWSSALGYLVFGAAPDKWTIVGAVIIACSGFYTVHHARMQLHKREGGARKPAR